MTTSTVQLVTRPLTPADHPAVLALLQQSLAGGPTGERTAEFLEWKHVTNHFGPSLALGALDGDRLVGVRLVMRWAFQLGGQRVRAGRMVDTATHPDYRGRGIFRDLTQAALEEARSDTDLIFNTPNASSRPGYLKMGWQPVGTVATSLSPVRPLRFARGIRSALAAAGHRATFDTGCPFPRFADLLAERPDELADLVAARRGLPVTGLRTDVDVEFLRWRYAVAPGLDYRAVVVEEAGRLAAVGIGRVRPRGALVEFTLADVISRPGDHRSVGRVLAACRRGGGDHVATHLPRPVAPRAVLLRRGYLTSGRLGLGLTALPLHPMTVDPLDLACWSLSLGDVEVF